MTLAIIRIMRNVFRAIVTSLLGVTFFSMGAAPAVAEAEPGDGPADKILVLPFNALNPSEYQAWLGRSIQQSLLADLTAVAPGRVSAPDIDVRDANAALDAGRKNGARYVVFGNFTTVDHDLRLTGQVLDVSTAKPVTALKATGDVHDVLRLEDQVAAEIRQPLALGPAQPPTPVANGPYPEPATGPAQPAMPNDYYSTYVNPANTTYYNNYYYDNPYGYSGYDYGWGYPWYGWYGLGFGFASSPFFFHHHFHDRDFHDHNFHDRNGIRFHDSSSEGLFHSGSIRAYGSSPSVGSGVYHPGGLQIVPGSQGLRIQGFGARGGAGHFGGGHFGGGRMGGGGFGGARAGGGGGHR